MKRWFRAQAGCDPKTRYIQTSALHCVCHCKLVTWGDGSRYDLPVWFYGRSVCLTLYACARYTHRQKSQIGSSSPSCYFFCVTHVPMPSVGVYMYCSSLTISRNIADIRLQLQGSHAKTG